MRHGETDWNKLLKIQGSTDIPLNQEGIDLAERVSYSLHNEGISFDKVYSSPLVRAKETAIIINKYSNAPIVFDERLREFCFGKAEGVTLDELNKNPKYLNIRNWFFKPENYKAEFGAETYESFFSRIDSFIDDLKNETCKNILIVCHGGLVRGFIKEVSDLPIDKIASIKIHNCAVNLIKYENGKFFVEYIAKSFA